MICMCVILKLLPARVTMKSLLTGDQPLFTDDAFFGAEAAGAGPSEVAHDGTVLPALGQAQGLPGA